MEQFIYAIKDSKSGFSSQLMIFPNDQLAIRYFKVLSEDDNSLLHKYKEDFSLWCVGSVDLKTGVINSNPNFIYTCYGE